MITALASLALGLAAGQIVYLDYLWRHRGVTALPPAPPAPDDPVLLSADLAELLTDDTICDLAELARHHEDASPAEILRACMRVQVLAERGAMSRRRPLTGTTCPSCGRPLVRGLFSPYPRPFSHGKPGVK